MREFGDLELFFDDVERVNDESRDGVRGEFVCEIVFFEYFGEV